MKIAIFHNYLDNIGGAEIVDLLIAKELGADIYTTNIDVTKINQMGFSTDNIYSIGRVPINAPWRQEVAYWKFRRLNLGNKYDFYIIAGDWAMSAAINHRPNLWYVYSPTREIWDLRDYVHGHIVDWWQKPLFKIWTYVRSLIFKYDLHYVQQLIATSANVQGRISRYLGRNSRVIYPPIVASQYHYKQNGDFWLSVNRLFHHKRIELQIEAFRQMPDKKLVIVGSYEKSRHFSRYANSVMNNLPPNIEVLNWISDNQLKDLYANCRGLLATALDEDFGLTPVEAMASGKPVVAPNEGGYRETIIDGQTGILIDDIDFDKVVQAVKEIDVNPEKYKEPCIRQVQKFDIVNFISDLKSEISK